VVTKEHQDTSPSQPVCTGLDTTSCSAQPPLNYALAPFACGDLGDIGSLYCIWSTLIPGCINKTGQTPGNQQRCR
jgi:hypothetical protein